MHFSDRQSLLIDLAVSAVVACFFVALLFFTDPYLNKHAIILLSTPAGFLARLLSVFSLVGHISLFFFFGDAGELSEPMMFIILLSEWTVIFFVCSCAIRLLLRPLKTSYSRADFFYRHVIGVLCLLLVVLGFAQRPSSHAIANDCLRGRSADTEKCIDLLLDDQVNWNSLDSKQSLHDLISYCMDFAPLTSLRITRPGGFMRETRIVSSQEYCIYRLAEQLRPDSSRGNALSQLLIQYGKLYPVENETEEKLFGMSTLEAEIFLLEREKKAIRGMVSLCSMYAIQRKSENVYDQCVAYFIDNQPSWITIDAIDFLCDATREVKPSKCSTHF